MTQQPFYLKFDRLYISDEIAKSLSIRNINNTKLFFDNIRHDGVYTGYKSTFLLTTIHVKFKGMHSMSILVYRGTDHENDYGKFKYYVGGISGDSEMHGKNMIRATKECNLNFIYKIYPFTINIKNFKKLITYNKFTDIIFNSLKNNEFLFSDLSLDIQKIIRKIKLNNLDVK